MDNGLLSGAPLTTSSPPVVLCVDDEKSILSSLKRLFRPTGYRFLTAENGPAGLKILETENVDLVISDMRMPGMDGAEFLEHVAKKWPKAQRVLLTGFADMKSTIAAVNRGKIYKYIAKPWDDNDLLATAEQAIERKQIEDERDRLVVLTRKQNEQLQILNGELEVKVAERTADLAKMLEELNSSHEALKKNYVATLRGFSSLLELKDASNPGHARRVADYARRLASELGLNARDTQQLVFASLLHDIGKLAIPDRLLKKPFNALNSEERVEMARHPVIGHSVLSQIEPLAEAAEIVRHYHENFDGTGYPDKLAGKDIPLGARILSVAYEFESLQSGVLTSQKLSLNDAKAFIIRNRVKRFDPDVVKAFVKIFGEVCKPPENIVMKISEARKTPPAELVEGMVLMQDIVTKDGVLLLNKGKRLNEGLARYLQEYEDMTSEKLEVWVSWMLDN